MQSTIVEGEDRVEYRANLRAEAAKRAAGEHASDIWLIQLPTLPKNRSNDTGLLAWRRSESGLKSQARRNLNDTCIRQYVAESG